MDQPIETVTPSDRVVPYAQGDTPRPRRRWWWIVRTPLAVVVAVLMGGLSFWLFTRNNDFPIHYHPDEPSKVQQILDSTQPRNFNHPLLLLEAANVARQWAGIPDDSESGYRGTDKTLDAAIIGRSASAALAAIGVFALALASYIAYGFPGLLVGGSVMALCPPLLVYAHYFKEDASLVSGIMVAVLGARLLLSGRNEWTQLLAAAVLGIGCGAAASGKYVGAVTIVPCIIALAIAPVPNWTVIPIRIFAFVLATAGTVVGINQRGFADWKSLRIARVVESTIEEEFDHGTGGHYGLTLPKRNTFCLGIAASEVMPHLWAIGAAGLLWAIWKHRITRWGIVVASFLLTWMAALSMNTIPFGRYALPITVLGYFALAQLACSLVSTVPGGARAGLAALVAVLAVVVPLQLLRCMRIDGQFLDDSRQRLYEWAATNVPTNTNILADGYTALGFGGDPRRFPKQPWRQPNVTQPFFACDYAGTPEAAALRGFDYIAVAAPNYDRFFVPGIMPIGRPEGTAPRQRQFYEELFKKGTLVWSADPDPDTHAYVNPQLRLYKVSHLRGN